MAPYGWNGAPARGLGWVSSVGVHASSPHSVTLMQLRFASFAVINLREDLHLQECARAGRTKGGMPLMAQSLQKTHPVLNFQANPARLGRFTSVVFSHEPPTCPVPTPS